MRKRPKSEQTSGCYPHHWTGTAVQSFKLGVYRNKCLANKMSHADWGTCSSNTTDGYRDSWLLLALHKQPIKSRWDSCDSALTSLHFHRLSLKSWICVWLLLLVQAPAQAQTRFYGRLLNITYLHSLGRVRKAQRAWVSIGENWGWFVLTIAYINSTST